MEVVLTTHPDDPVHPHPDYRSPSLEGDHAIRRTLIAAGLSILAAAFAALSTWGGLPGVDRWASPTVLRLALLGLAVSLAAYAVQRETRERRLVSELSDERVLSTAYFNQVRDLSAIASMSRTVNGGLEFDHVLRILLDEALGFFEGAGGSVMLLDAAGFLQTATSRGSEGARNARLKLGDSVAGYVALTREPMLLNGRPNPERFRDLVQRAEPVESAMCVPLVHRDVLLGVVNVNAQTDRPFADHDLQLLTIFASHGALAIANARAFAAERAHAQELAEINGMKSDMIASTSRDLRAPLAALSEGIAALRRPTHGDASGLLDAMQEHVRRLEASVEGLLSEADLERDGRIGALDSADLCELARIVAEDFEAHERPVEVDAVGVCEVTGDHDLLQQVLWNLLDNAFKYGEPPIKIEVRIEGEHGIVSIIDRGPGVSPRIRQRLFSRLPRAQGGDHEGMGLGLSIVHGIVSAHGGRVWADDAEGGGAVFRVALPLANGFPIPSQQQPSKEVPA